MQVHPRKLEGADEHRKAKLYMLVGIIAIAVAILVTIFMTSQHYAEGNSIISQICYHKGAHLCYFPAK